jgi:hypothetical protein
LCWSYVKVIIVNKTPGKRTWLWGLSNPNFISCGNRLLSSDFINKAVRMDMDKFCWTDQVSSERYQHEKENFVSPDGLNDTQYFLCFWH